jgi:hypothetical protein
MATTTRSDQQRRASNDDRSPRARDLALRPPSRRVRVPELAIGLLVVVVFALGGVLWHLRSVDRTPILAVASPIGRGEVVQAEDLRVVYVASEDRLAGLRPEDTDRVVGMIALVDLASGSIVTEDLVGDGARVGEDDGVVGLPLEPGQYPAFDLAPGDRVNVVRIGAGEPSREDDRDESGAVVVRAVEVMAVEDLAGGERKLVSLLASEEDAESIGALDSVSLRLVLVSP